MIANYDLLMTEINNIYINNKEYEIVKTKSGGYSVKINKNNKPFYLHSKYDPIKEGEIFARQNMPLGNFAVYGLGMGYHIKPLIKALLPGQKLLVFEGNIQVIKAAFEYTDIMQYLQADNVEFYYSGNINELAQLFSDALIECSGYALHKPSMKLVPLLEERALISVGGIEITSDNKKVIFYNASSQYGALSVFENFLSDSFKRLGYSVISINISDDYFGLNTLHYIKDCKFILSFCELVIMNNAHALKALFEAVKIPFVFISVDDPVFQYANPAVVSKNSIYTWIDKNHVKLFDRLKDFYPPVKNEFLPHGGECGVESVTDNDRMIDILLSGSITEHYKAEIAFASINGDLDIVKEIAEYCISNPSVTIEDSFEHILNIRMNFSNKILHKYLKLYGCQVYRYVWAKRRYMTVKAVLDSNLTITCFGNGWEKTDFINNINFKYLGTVEYNKQREVFNDAKIVLNIMCTKKNGSHERIFSSMIYGSLCLTDYSDYLGEKFVDGEDIVFYDMSKPEDLPNKINIYLRDEKERIRIAENGRVKAKNEHTWFERAKRLLEILETV